MNGYSAEISYTTKEMDVIEKIRSKNITSALKIDDIFNSGENELILNVDHVYTLNVHNEKSEDKDYKKYIFVSDNGDRYVSGSESLITAFMDIYDEFIDAGIKGNIPIRIYQMESKNYKGKNFYTCELANEAI